MPIHDYTCGKCAKTFELLVRAGEKPVCPACGAANPQRSFSYSAAMSTGRSRERALKVARGKAGAVKREKDHAHQVYLREHMKDHGGV